MKDIDPLTDEVVLEADRLKNELEVKFPLFWARRVTRSSGGFLNFMNLLVESVQDPEFSDELIFNSLRLHLDQMQDFLEFSLKRPPRGLMDEHPPTMDWQWVASWIAASVKAVRRAASDRAESDVLTDALDAVSNCQDSNSLSHALQQLELVAQDDLVLGKLQMVDLLQEMRDQLKIALGAPVHGTLKMPEESSVNWFWLAHWMYSAAVEN